MLLREQTRSLPGPIEGLIRLSELEIDAIAKWLEAGICVEALAATFGVEPADIRFVADRRGITLNNKSDIW